MATDAWQIAKDRFLTFWRARRPESADAVGAELAETRTEVVAARNAGDTATEQALVGAWQLRVGQLQRAQLVLAEDLRRLIDDELLPLLDAEARPQITQITMHAEASGQGRVYQAGRNQTIHER